MTDSAQAGEAAGHDSPVLAPERPPDHPGEEDGDRRSASGRRGDWFWARGFPVLLVVMAVSVPALLIAGRNIVLHSTEGAIEQQVTDPSAPGWQAFAEPTPVALVLHRGDGGVLGGITLVSLTGPGDRAVVFIPVDTVVGPDPGRTLAEFAAEGEPALRAALDRLLGFSPSDIVTLDAAGWREAIGAAGPLTVENPDAVFAAADDRSVLRFARGTLTLPVADVPEFLLARNPGERDLNRMVRHEALWRAWLEALRRMPAPPSGPGVLGRYAGALASGRVDMATLPVQTAPARGPSADDRFVPVPAQVRELLGRIVPFPVGGPTTRLRIRLLDGVGTLHHGLDAAAGLVARGGQIDQIGNATTFAVPRTTLVYSDDARRPGVEALAAELGVGEVVKAAGIESGTDVVVTLGQDYVSARTGQGGSGG
jgi:hypothetical protein